MTLLKPPLLLVVDEEFNVATSQPVWPLGVEHSRTFTVWLAGKLLPDTVTVLLFFTPAFGFTVMFGPLWPNEIDTRPAAAVSDGFGSVVAAITQLDEVVAQVPLPMAPVWTLIEAERVPVAVVVPVTRFVVSQPACDGELHWTM
jgi:hypothetical protein